MADKPIYLVIEQGAGGQEIACLYYDRLFGRATKRVYTLRIDKLPPDQQQFWLSKPLGELLDVYRWLKAEGTLPPSNLADPPKEKPRTGLQAQQRGRRGVSIHAISLWQPWASFIAVGVKPYETRDWAPPAYLIGQRIAIHAAKKRVSADDRAWADDHGIRDLPLGAIVCTAILRGAYLCGCFDNHLTRAVQVADARKGSPRLLTIMPDEFGDYNPGRWAWALTDIEPISPAIPARGMQGIWKWDGGAA